MMKKKIMVLLLSVSLLSGLLTVTVNPSSVMALVGLSSLDVNTLEKVQQETITNLRAGIDNLYARLANAREETHVSSDKVVTIKTLKGDKTISVEMKADASLLPDMDYKDIGKLMKVAQDYLKPILTEKQAAGFCSLLIGDAYAQYRRGLKNISITKEFEGITIRCSGNVDTGLFEIHLKSTVGVKQCQPGNRERIMEMKASRL